MATLQSFRALFTLSGWICMLLARNIIVSAQQATLPVILNPNCNSQLSASDCSHSGPSKGDINSWNNLIWLATGSRSVSHSAASTPNVVVDALVSTIYAPTVVIYEQPQTGATAQPAIDWATLLGIPFDKSTSNFIALPDAGAFDGRIFAVTVSKLIEFNSTQSSDTLSHADQVRVYDLSAPGAMKWQNVEMISNSSDHLAFNIRSMSNSAVNLTLLVNAWPTAADGARDDDMPRLLHAPGTLQIQLLVNQTRMLANGAFAVELNVISNVLSSSNPPPNEAAASLFHYEKSTIVDDEFSPGVFSSAIVRLTSQANTNNQHGYMLWKPVAYNDAVKNTESALVTRTQSIQNLAASPLSIAQGLNTSSGNVFRMSALNITFGESGAAASVGDSAYYAWTALIGSGDEKTDGISSTVVLVIILGLGIPAAMLLLVMGYLIYWKRTTGRRQAAAAAAMANYTDISNGSGNPIVVGGSNPNYASDL